MNFLKTQLQPNRISKPGDYPILDPKEALACTIGSLAQNSTNITDYNIITGRTDLIIPPEERTPDWYIFESGGYFNNVPDYIQPQLGYEWEQITEYNPYTNNIYLGGNNVYFSRNVWTRNNNIITFKVLIFVGGVWTLYQTTTYDLTLGYRLSDPSCKNVEISFEGDTLIFNTPTYFPPNNRDPESGTTIDGSYSAKGAPANPAIGLGAGQIEIKRWTTSIGKTWRLVAIYSSFYDRTCSITRQVRLFEDFWPNTGAYNYPPTAFSLCTTIPPTLVPACLFE